MAAFPWGKSIDLVALDFDGPVIQIEKYHPWKRDVSGQPIREANTAVVLYHVEELRESFETVEQAVIAWIAYRNLGHNQHALVAGVWRALGVSS